MKRLFIVALVLGGLGFAQQSAPPPANFREDPGVAVNVAPTVRPAPKPLSRDALEKRLEELKELQQKVMADYNAVTGAMQETQHWLDLLKAAEKTPPPKQEPLPIIGPALKPDPVKSVPVKK